MTPALAEDLRGRLRERALATTAQTAPTVQADPVRDLREVRQVVRAHATVLEAVLVDAGRPDPEVADLRAELATLRAFHRTTGAIVLLLAGAILGETVLWAVLLAAWWAL